MFGFAKKNKPVLVVAPATGSYLAITAVKDPVFASQAVGDGFAIEPTNGQIVSPVTGQVMSIFPTKHALMIQTKSGIELLVHLGIDTVELKGKPFQTQVTVGDQVSAGQDMMLVDLDQVKAAGKLSTIMVVCSNGDFSSELTASTSLQAGDDVGQYQLKTE